MAILLGIGTFLVAFVAAFPTFAVDPTQSPSAAATPTASSPPVPRPAHGAVPSKPPVPTGQEIYMPAGQLESHWLRVYIARDIRPNQNPKLQLLRSHAVTKEAAGTAEFEKLDLVAPGQEWSEPIDG
jgi:hypothetical protein